MSFFAELRRRNVFRVGIAYVLMGWVLLQGADFVLDLIGAPEWVIRVFALAVVIGLPIALLFAWAFEMTPEGLKREHEVDRSQSITPKTGKKLDRAIIVLLGLGVVYLLMDKFVLTPGTPAPATGVVMEEPAPVEEQEKSIAVLPFNNMSEDASNEFFSDGISEEILNALAQVKELKVAGRTSSFAFKGRNEDLRLIGETLGVNHILEGSVRKAGNKVRITAQLIQVEDGFHLWSETYDRELTDIFAIQDEISSAILAELKAELIGGQTIASESIDTDSYEKYLLATQRIYSRTRPELEYADKLLEEVTLAEPEFASAWAQRGIVVMLLSDLQYGTIPHEEAYARAKRYFDKALELDERTAEGWAGLGLYYQNQTGAENWQRAVDHLEKALEINPSMINASNWLQQSLAALNRSDDALVILEDMFERDPLYRPALGNLSWAYARTGQMDKARAAIERVEPFLEDAYSLANDKAMLNVWSGEFAEALPLAREAYERAPTVATNQVAYGITLLMLNDFEAALEVDAVDPWMKISALRNLGRMEEGTLLAGDWAAQNPSHLIQVLAQQGEHEELVRLVESGWPDLDAFDRDWGGFFGFGNPNLIYIAKAYRETGNDEKFQQAMRLVRASHDLQTEQGVRFAWFWITEATYWTLMDDHEQAIDFLERAVEAGWVATPRISQDYFLLKPLEGHPRFEAAQSRMLEHLNRERVEAGYEPLEPGYAL